MDSGTVAVIGGAMGKPINAKDAKDARGKDWGYGKQSEGNDVSVVSSRRLEPTPGTGCSGHLYGVST